MKEQPKVNWGEAPHQQPPIILPERQQSIVDNIELPQSKPYSDNTEEGGDMYEQEEGPLCW